jgi:hypothetical protein
MFPPKLSSHRGVTPNFNSGWLGSHRWTGGTRRRFCACSAPRTSTRPKYSARSPHAATPRNSSRSSSSRRRRPRSSTTQASRNRTGGGRRSGRVVASVHSTGTVEEWTVLNTSISGAKTRSGCMVPSSPPAPGYRAVQGALRSLLHCPCGEGSAYQSVSEGGCAYPAGV